MKYLKRVIRYPGRLFSRFISKHTGYVRITNCLIITLSKHNEPFLYVENRAKVHMTYVDIHSHLPEAEAIRKVKAYYKANQRPEKK